MQSWTPSSCHRAKLLSEAWPAAVEVRVKEPFIHDRFDQRAIDEEVRG